MVEVSSQVQLQKDKRVSSGGLFCRRASVYHAAAKNQRGTRIKFITHDSMTAMQRRLDAVDADMLPVLRLTGPASSKKGTRRQPRSGVLHTDVGDLVSRVERLQQTNSKHVPRRRQHP